MNGVGRGRIARLNADGTLDTGFDPGTGFHVVMGGSPFPSPYRAMERCW
ncbi:MAG: delta-60 repeat domain-containing protein [Flavobacteriales bacterium]|nr:delta-60 repeat domain-containing protein [Flavobacteriales bacterium]